MEYFIHFNMLLRHRFFSDIKLFIMWTNLFTIVDKMIIYIVGNRCANTKCGYCLWTCG